MWILENDYHLAWAAYLLGAVGGLLVAFRITRWMWRWLREILRLLVAVLLFTPTLIAPEKMHFAPAIGIAALDLLFGMGSDIWRAASDLALYGTAAFVLYLVFAVLRWIFTRYRRPAEDPRTLAERLKEEGKDEPTPSRERREPRL